MAHLLTLFLACGSLGSLGSLGCLDARDFGTVGTTFPIHEQNLLDYLRERLMYANANDKDLQGFYQQQRLALVEPKELGLPNAKENRVFFYDPTVTSWQEVKDDEGNVIVKRGEQYNPLDTRVFPCTFLFFDATQAAHVEWAKTQMGMWILVKGSPIKLEEKEGVRVYFDQFGYLTKRFGIQAIPAKVSQEGNRLKVEEFALEEEEEAEGLRGCP